MLYYVGMVRGINSRVLGAGLIGVALVAGAWVLNSLQSTPVSPEAAVSVATVPAPVRSAIAVSDTDGDGVEDWREPLLTAEPVILNTITASYTRSNTLTEQVGISLMEQLFLTKSMNPDADTAPLVESSIARLGDEAKDTLYTYSDIQVGQANDPETIRLYANTIATAFATNDVKGKRNEILILQDALTTGDARLYKEISEIATMYQKNLAFMLETEVPASLAQEHLDLINVFHALNNSISAMANLDNDPLKALLRIQRYQDDASGLVSAMRNMYTKINQYPGVLGQPNDPATILFYAFSPAPAGPRLPSTN